MTTAQQTAHKVTLSDAHHDFAKGLNKHAFFKVHSHQTGEDLVQDTFAKTWKFLIKGGKINMMKAFLYHVLNNLIIDEYRKEKRKTTSLDTLLEEGFEPSTDDFERVFDNLDGQTAMLLINALAPVYKKVMTMGYMEQLSAREISGITGQTPNAVAVQMHRGLANLKVLYDR